MQQILGATSKIIVDTKGGNQLLYLPIDKLMQMAQSRDAQVSQVPIEPAPQSSSASGVSGSSPVPDNIPRRDSLRSRDREGGR